MSAVMIAQAIANNMAQAQDAPPPEAEAISEEQAQFAIDTPVGRFRVDVTLIEDLEVTS